MSAGWGGPRRRGPRHRAGSGRRRAKDLGAAVAANDVAPPNARPADRGPTSYAGEMPTIAAFPAFWLGLGGEALPVDGRGAALAGSIGLGANVTEGLWLEVRGAAEVEGLDRNTLRADGMTCEACIPSEVGGARQFLDLRVGFVPFHGAVDAPGGGGPALGLGLFVGAGALTYDRVDGGVTDRGLARPVAPTTVVGGELRLRWPGRGLGAEVYAEAADRSWIEVTKGTSLELRHEAVFGLGVRLVVARGR